MYRYMSVLLAGFLWYRYMAVRLAELLCVQAYICTISRISVGAGICLYDEKNF